MAISVMRPVPYQYPITGEFLDTTPPTWSASHPHLGVDFGCPTGTTVVSATIPGKVFAVHRKGDGWGDSSFGTCVVVDVIGTPYYYLYAHLSAVLVTEGQSVNSGDVIGQSGASGKDGPNTYGAHLHVQVSESPDFPRNVDITGDPILGIRHVTPPAPEEPEPIPLITVDVVNAKIDSLNAAVIGIRDANAVTDAALDTRLQSIERGIDALVTALAKG